MLFFLVCSFPGDIIAIDNIRLVFSAASTWLVSSINSCTDNCSGRLLKMGSVLNGFSLSKMEEIEFLKVLRRWLNVVFTMSLNNFSLHPSSVVSLRVIRMTALFTLGGGLNTCSCTVNRYSTLYQACIRILRMPYVLLPGPAAMRSATSFGSFRYNRVSGLCNPAF